MVAGTRSVGGIGTEAEQRHDVPAGRQSPIAAKAMVSCQHDMEPCGIRGTRNVQRIFEVMAARSFQRMINEDEVRHFIFW